MRTQMDLPLSPDRTWSRLLLAILDSVNGSGDREFTMSVDDGAAPSTMPEVPPRSGVTYDTPKASPRVEMAQEHIPQAVPTYPELFDNMVVLNNDLIPKKIPGSVNTSCPEGRPVSHHGVLRPCGRRRRRQKGGIPA